MAVTVGQFIERLTQSGLMSAAEVSAFQDCLPPDKRPKDAQQLAQALVQQGKLTKYQVQAVYEGKAKGLVFGQYVVLDKLGAGGMGVVLKAQHRRMKRTVAIKVLSSAAMKQAGAVERFHREAEAAAKLSHPNIVRAYDADEQQGMHYLAMEYVEGSDLATVVKERGPLPVQQAVECILQAARGLQYAHGKGIVHRDIKPGNLLLNNEGTVKILDMGMALIAGAEAALGGAERLTTTGQVMGTCDYMAPEQSLDTHQADARADIYSLGCTFYRLLTGSPPYQGETFAKLFLMHLEAPIPSLCAVRPEVPAALDVVCQRMLAKKPEDRYQSMAEVIGELEAVLGVSSGHSTPVAPPALPESPSESVSGRWAFLQEVAPRGTLTEQKKPTATGPAQPQVGPEHDTGPKGKGKGSNSNFPAAPKGPSHPWDRSPATPLGQGRATVARVGRKRLVLLGAGGGLVVLLLLAVVLNFALRQGTLVVEIDEQLGKDVQVAVSQGGEKVQVADARSGWTLSLDAGKYDLAVEGGDDPFQLDSESITVTRGGQVKVKVTLKPPPLAIAPFDAEQARTFQERWARQLGVPVEITNSIGMKLVLIPPGEFMMGSPKELIEEELKAHGDDQGLGQWYKERLAGEGPQHRVRITKAFYLGRYLVTQEEYQRVVGNNPSEFSATGQHKDQVAGQDTKRFPVENVSWGDAVEFCRKLSEMPEEKAAGRTYLLPSEAQWEYACRAGSTGRYSFSSARNLIRKENEEKSLSDYGWFPDNAGGRVHPVGLKRGIAWGLYDMQGDVWEWCADWYDKDYYAKSPTDDPAGPLGGPGRVLRGGGWGYPAWSCRSAYRSNVELGLHYHFLGFRVCLVLPDTAAERAKMSPSSDTAQPSGGSTASKSSPAVAGPDSPSPAGLPAVARLVGPKQGSKPEIPPPSEQPKPPAKDETKPDVEPVTPVSKPARPDELKAPLKKLDPPSPDEQKRLIGQIDEVYKSGEAKDQAAKAALARKLLEDGRKNEGHRAEQFVLLRRAGEIACEAGEADLMLEAVDAIAAAGFNVQPLQVKARLLKRLVEQGSSGGAHQISTVSASCVTFAEEAAASGAVQEASDVLDAAQESLVEPKKQAQKALHAARTEAARIRNPSDKAAREKKAAEAEAELEEIDSALGALTDCVKDLQQARDEHKAFQAMQERLKAAPDDPDACLAVGRWYCFSADDWDEGLKLLAKGSDQALKSLAAEELASKPSTAEGRVARGDAWWDLAEKTAGRPKAAMRVRAAYWYQAALPDLAPGLGKSKVEKRLAQAAEEPLPPEASTHRGRSLPRIVFGKWFPLLTSPDKLIGWDAINDHIRYSNGTLETRDGGTIGYPIVAKDVSIRTKAKKTSGLNISLSLRKSDKGSYYAAWFNGGRQFGIGKHVDGKWVDLKNGDSPKAYDDFFVFGFSAVGDTLTLSVNGQPLLETRDSSYTAGTASVGGSGSGLFTDVAMFIPTEASLVADNRKPPAKTAEPGKAPHAAGASPLRNRLIVFRPEMSMRPFPVGTRRDAFPVQMTVDPRGPFFGQPVYFQQVTGKCVVYDIQWSPAVGMVHFVGAAMERMTLEILDPRGTVVSQAGPFGGGNNWGEFAVTVPPAVGKKFRLRLTNNISEWYFIARLDLVEAKKAK